MKYIVTTQKLDDGSTYIELPDEVLEEMVWQEGDIIEWTEDDDGSYSLKKVEQ